MMVSFPFQAASFKVESSARPAAGNLATKPALKPAGGANRAPDDGSLEVR